MSREIKFRVWHKGEKRMFTPEALERLYICCADGWVMDTRIDDGVDVELMQFTGLHDKNSLKELYEGDIIDADGNLKGNIYESPQIYEEGIDCLIEGMGTEKWRSTESIAMGRGCKYTK